MYVAKSNRAVNMDLNRKYRRRRILQTLPKNIFNAYATVVVFAKNSFIFNEIYISDKIYNQFKFLNFFLIVIIIMMINSIF